MSHVSITKSGSDNLVRLTRLHSFAKAMYQANAHHTPIELMDISDQEVQNFLRSLHTNDVKYMLVGGVATVFYGHIRTTMDLDLWVQDTEENKKKLVQALKDAHVAGAEQYYNVEMIPGWSTVAIGEAGFEADLMGYTKAFKKEDFARCYERARTAVFEHIPITVIHINDLIEEKQQLARPKDLDDVEHLQRIEVARKRNKE